MDYRLQDAIDLLDTVATGPAPGPTLLVPGAIALGLHCEPGDDEQLAVLVDLEHLALGKVDRLSPESIARVTRVASALPRSLGMH